jgi:predicted metalloprotease
MARLISAALSVLLLLPPVTAVAQEPAPAGGSIVGAWTLDPDLSDKRPDRGQGDQPEGRGRRGGGGGGGGFRGGGGGGGFGGRGIAVGGGGLGLVGLIVVVLINVLGGGTGTGSSSAVPGFGAISQGGSADNTELEQDCRTGSDANRDVQCAAVAEINSIQDFWEQQLGGSYQRVDTVFFSGQVQTQCGNATSGSGPFYCPADKFVYIDLTFFDDLKNQFGAQGGLFVDAYVLAHEYGHHVQDLLGTNQQVQPGETGPTSGSVRLELQADCFAGVWAKGATGTTSANGQKIFKSLTGDDINQGIQTAGQIGDDTLQKQAGQQINPAEFTHGTSADRQKWFSRGYNSGTPDNCDTFASGAVVEGD